MTKPNEQIFPLKTSFLPGATPRADGASPAFLLFGFHPRRPGLPRLPTKGAMTCDDIAGRREERNTKDFAKKSGKHLNMLQVGDRVLLQSRTGTWDQEAVISSILPSGGSYTLTLPDGQLLTRGRCLLKQL